MKIHPNETYRDSKIKLWLYAKNGPNRSLFSLNRKTWKLYVPFHKSQQLQEQSACCIGVQALLNALAINFEVIESGKNGFTH